MQASQVADRPQASGSWLLGRGVAGAGRRLSILMSVLAAIAVWYFFIQMRGWKPTPGTESDMSTYVTWGLLIYLGIQLTLLIWTSTGGGRGEVWLDTVTALIPFVVVFYALVDHWRHLEEMPLEQLRLAKSTALATGIDFIADLGVAIATQRRRWFVR